MERKRIHVTGELGGTGFGSSAFRKAHSLMLAGHVDRQKDGSFIYEVEGTPEAVTEFVAWAERGTPRSKIAGVAVTELVPTGDTGFSKAEKDDDDSDDDGDETSGGGQGGAEQLALRAARKAERKAQRRAEKAGGGE